MQERCILITTKKLYNLKKKGPFNIFNNKLILRGVFHLKELKYIIYPTRGKEFALIFPNKFDLHYSIEQRNKLLQFLFLGISLSVGPEKKIGLFFIKEGGISKYLNHPSKKRLTWPVEECIEVTREEFYVHFLGISKEDVLSQRLDNQRITTKDFEFIQMLGVGDVSKVYLAKKKDTNELFAVKVLAYGELYKETSKTKFRELVLHERDILVKIDHPFIVKLKYAFQDKSNFCFAMSFVQ